jgi:hypothetical protein
MDKYTINQTLDLAQVLMDKEGDDCPQAFALTWIAWEQLGYRVFKVAAYMDGWNQKTVFHALRSLAANSQPPSINTLIQRISGVNPANFSGNAGEIWMAYLVQSLSIINLQLLLFFLWFVIQFG